MVAEEAQLRAQNIQNAISNFGQNKRAVAVGAGVITVIITIMIVLGVYSNSKNLGNQIELVKGVEQGRAFEIVSNLKAQGIESKIEAGEIPGKVSVTVFEKQFDQAAISLSRSDLLLEEGFNLFDKTDWAASDYDKKVKLSRAINGDLSRIISRTDGIKWATVRINVPEQELFTENESPTTATVQIELKEDETNISKSQVKSIINLLVGYVPNLRKENISIVDTAGKTYSAVSTDEMAATELLEESEKINKAIQGRIEEYLTPLLGNNNFIVRVSSEISRDKVEQSATTFTDGAIGQEQLANESLGGSNAQIESVGPPSPNANKQTVSSGNGYSKLNRVVQRYPSYEQKNISSPPGKISQVKVAVAINRGVPASVSVKQLQEGIAAIASPSTALSDVKITVAEFYGSQGIKKGAKKSNPASVFSNIPATFNELPVWGKVIASIVAVLIVLNVLGSMLPKPQPSQQSTLAQINQTRRQQEIDTQRQLAANPLSDRPIAELPPFRQEIPQPKPDISSVLTGLEEAAVQKPDFVANRLQLWLEEGSKL